MKKAALLAGIPAALLGVILLPLLLGAPVTQNGVTINLTQPQTGDTVQGVITLAADASSVNGPIQRVEYYIDGQLVATATNRTPTPANLRVTQ